MPVFTYGSRDESIGAPSAEDAIREFFFCRDERVVDAVVTPLFFLLDRGRWHRRADRFKIAETGVVEESERPNNNANNFILLSRSGPKIRRALTT
ncbi:MAG: hypothetical protein RQ839_08950 [Thermoproteus sp.]|nr:hypothetical protein [Thermoproteus sp.]MDT7882337.1 hypothetical protein [Thermoproteus sp.]